MANQKISDLTALTLPVSGDLLTIIDVSDTTMGASGTNKKITFANFEANLTIANQTGGTASGTGNLVRVSSPTLVTPVLGVATATSINKVALTAPATSATLTIADGKTATISNTLTLAGTDGKGIDVGAATSGKILIGNGTNMVLSTPTYPTAAGTSGNVLTSDGTNWTSATPSSGGVPAWVSEASATSWSAENTDKTITLTNTGKDVYMLIISLSSGAPTLGLQFNSDTGGNYNYRTYSNTAIAQSNAQTSIQLLTGGASGTSRIVTVYIAKTAAGAISVSVQAGYPSDGSISSPITLSGSWANSGAAISTVQVLVGGSTVTGKARLYSLDL